MTGRKLRGAAKRGLFLAHRAALHVGLVARRSQLVGAASEIGAQAGRLREVCARFEPEYRGNPSSTYLRTCRPLAGG